MRLATLVEIGQHAKSDQKGEVDARMTWNEFVGTVSLLYALANPIGVIPILLELLRRQPATRQTQIVAAVGVSFIVDGIRNQLTGVAG